jgi:hypothetical protein
MQSDAKAEKIKAMIEKIVRLVFKNFIFTSCFAMDKMGF